MLYASQNPAQWPRQRLQPRPPYYRYPTEYQVGQATSVHIVMIYNIALIIWREVFPTTYLVLRQATSLSEFKTILSRHSFKSVFVHGLHENHFFLILLLIFFWNYYSLTVVRKIGSFFIIIHRLMKIPGINILLLASWEVHIVKNCDRGLENAARGRIFFQALKRKKNSRKKNSRKRYCDRGKR